MNCMDRALVTLLALNFLVNAILICYLLPNTYINNLLEGILCRKCVENPCMVYCGTVQP